MINISEVLETNKMIQDENLDVRTITMGVSLLDCADADLAACRRKIRAKLVRCAGRLVRTGEEIARDFGVPIVNKRISITPISLVGAACCQTPADYVALARTLDETARELGVNFLGGYSAVVSKGMTPSDERLIRSIPEALAVTERVCASVNVGSTKTGLDMDAIRLMGEIVKETAARTQERDSLGCAKLVVLCNAPDDNPFMAGAFHGVTEADAIVNVGVSGPGVVKCALEQIPGADFETLCETIKRPPSRSRASASSSPRRPRAASACPSASSTSPSPPRPPWATPWRTSSRPSASNTPARPAPPPRSPS